MRIVEAVDFVGGGGGLIHAGPAVFPRCASEDENRLRFVAPPSGLPPGASNLSRPSFGPPTRGEIGSVGAVDALWILPRSRGRGTMRSMVEGV